MHWKTVTLYLASALAVVALLVFVTRSPSAETVPPASAPESTAGSEAASPASETRELAMSCVTHGGISYHVHPQLAIVIDGQRREIPANVGIDARCMHALHTHDETGTIHVEYPVEKPFTLGDFFAVWGEPFDREHLLDASVVDSSRRIRMTVNGKDSQEFEGLVLRDTDAIVLYYEEVPEN